MLAQAVQLYGHPVVLHGQCDESQIPKRGTVMTSSQSGTDLSAKMDEATTETGKMVEVDPKHRAKLDGNLVIENINLEKIVATDFHPRSDLGDIDSLAGSIERDGLLTPPTVMFNPETGDYESLFGKRMIAACGKLGKASVPCIVRPKVDDAEAAHLSYMENKFRKDFNPIEEALHYQRMKNLGYTHSQLTVKGYGTGANITNKLKILTLPPDVQELIKNGKITETAGLKLLNMTVPEEQVRMAKEAIRFNDSVTALEKRIKRFLAVGSKVKSSNTYTPNALDPDLKGIFLRDSRDMSEIPDNSVDMVLGSPPHGVGKFEFEEKYNFDSMLNETHEVVKEVARTLKSGCVAAINCTDIQHYVRKQGQAEHKEWLFVGPLIQNEARKHGLILNDVIQWVKQISWSTKLNYSYAFDGKKPHAAYRHIKQTEQIFIFRKNGEREFPEGEVALRSRLSQEQWKSWCSNVWNIPTKPGQNQEGHPCVYPEELCHRLIKMYSYEGETVLDPWLGSGTTVKVARDLNRIGIGYERELKYKPVIMKKLGIKPVSGLADLKPIKMIKYAEEQLEASIPDKTAGANGQLVEDKSGFLPDLQGIAIDPTASDSADQYFCSYV